jgi:ATP-binding cassette, subfamily B, bacterial
MRDFIRGLRLILWASFRASPKIAFVGLTFEPLAVVMASTMALFTKWIVDGAASGNISSIRNAVIGIATVVVINGILRSVGWPLRTRLLEETGTWLDARVIALGGQMPGLEHFERPEYFDRVQSAEGSGFASSIMFIVGALASMGRMAVLIGMLASIHPPLALLPLFGLPSLWVGIRAEERGTQAWHDSRPHAHMADALYELNIQAGPAKELRVFGLEAETRRLHEAHREQGRRILTRASIISTFWQTLGWAVFALGYLGALALVAIRARNGEATIGDLALAIAAAAQMNDAVSGVVEAIQGLAGRLHSAKHFLWLEDEAERSRVDVKSSVPEAINDGIRFEDVSFTYPGTEQTVLESVNLHLPAGARVAIVGDNGAGKTTLVKLLSGFYQPTSGRVLVDLVDLAEVDPAAWRSRLAAGFQDYCRFELRAQRTVGVGDLPSIDDPDSVMRGLGRAGAGDLPAKLASGLETQLGRSFDDGVDLSMGQWQKLALGRAFMRADPLLLILDEPTSSLDAPTEHALFSRYAAVAEERKASGAITLLVSHRFSTVRTADMIIVVEGGHIREVGGHDELMGLGGLYAELFTLQASAYR